MSRAISVVKKDDVWYQAEGGASAPIVRTHVMSLPRWRS
jgi:hypothetical protein